MRVEEFFNQANVIDLSFFNFKNAVTAAFFADKDLRILKTNKNFRSFFPILGNVSNVPFLDVLKQLGVSTEEIETFDAKLRKNGFVQIPHIIVEQKGEEPVFSLLATYTQDDSFTYLNGVQGQFVDRTNEHQLRKDREQLLEERMKDQVKIEEKSRRLEDLANKLAKYLSPQIYESIFSEDSKDTKKLSRKNLTIFFSDIVGFTDISDGMEPEKLALLINTYLSEMSNIALEFGGTIDKFIGDAILIFFGDPETDGEKADALKCAKMALRMQEKNAELQEVWRSNGISKPLHVRMGISTGYCTVGNFGSDQRLEYTILGSPVNLSSRLQSATEADTILLSESTYVLLKDVCEFEPAGSLTPKGFMRSIDTYRLMSINDEAKGISDTMTQTGEYVSVSILNKNKVREAIEELKRIQEEFERQNHLADSD